MAYRFMQQDSRPAWTKHNGHGACGGGFRLEIHTGLPDHFVRKLIRPGTGE